MSGDSKSEIAQALAPALYKDFTEAFKEVDAAAERYRAGGGPGLADFVPTETAALPPWMSLEFVCSKLTDILGIDPASPTEDIVHAVSIAIVERQEAREHGERMRKQLETVLAPGGDRDAWHAFAVACAALEDHAKAGTKLQADYRAALERLSIVAARSARGSTP